MEEKEIQDFYIEAVGEKGTSMEAVEKLADVIGQFCILTEAKRYYLARNLIKAGYLPVEEVHLEVLTDEGICHLFEQWADEYEDVEMTDAEWELLRSKLLIEATIAANEKRLGKIYRRIE